MQPAAYDMVFVGGGLASGLTAWRLAQQQPACRVLIVEQATALGGNHTWSFFPTDLTALQLDWIAPLIVHQWSSYEVRFPARTRTLPSGYCSTDSARFADIVGPAPAAVRLGCTVVAIEADHIVLDDGEVIRAPCIVDGRGPAPSSHLALGFQKFTGLVVRLAAPHGLAGPIIMDATVPQDGDYRFVYTLPVGPRELLVEDTRYSNTPVRDGAADTAAIHDYCVARGWHVEAVLREEHGALPITLGGNIDGFWAAAAGIPKIGLRAALFHATTGYSFADAVRTADLVASRSGWTTATLFDAMRRQSVNHWRAQAYWRLLNRMLFIAADPAQRWVVMQRFYGLRVPLIERFYAGRSSAMDKLRILAGKPPVAIIPALRCLPESSANAFAGENT